MDSSSKQNQSSLPTEGIKKKITKTTHVPTACINCKKAHLACDLSRPCKRCSSLGKSDSCIDIKHKKRGRPKLSSIKRDPKFVDTSSRPSFQSVPYLPIKSFKPNYAMSSFRLTATKDTLKAQQEREPPQTMTIFLSMDLCCARISDESYKFLNTNPATLGHCSLYDIIHPQSSGTLSRIHRILLDNCHHHVTQPISFTPASSEAFLTTSPMQLLSIANGSQTLKDTLRFKDGENNLLDCQFYLGGGFGGDLFVPNSLSQLYMVCLVTTSNVVESILAHDDHLLTDPELLSLYHNPTTSTNENDAIQLVNHLCETIMSPNSVESSNSPTPNTIPANGYNSSSSMSDDGLGNDFLVINNNDPYMQLMSATTEFNTITPLLHHHPQHQDKPPIDTFVEDLLHDNNTYWLGQS